jgi:hypothetical protein
MEQNSINSNDVMSSQAGVKPGSAASTAVTSNAGTFGGTTSMTNRRSLSEYAVNVVNVPEDEWQIDSKDENLEFFQRVSHYFVIFSIQ